MVVPQDSDAHEFLVLKSLATSHIRFASEYKLVEPVRRTKGINRIEHPDDCLGFKFRNPVCMQMVFAHQHGQFPEVLRYPEAFTNAGDQRQTEPFMAVMFRPFIFRCGGLAEVVYQCGKSHLGCGRKTRGLLQYHQCMYPGIDFGVMLLRLWYAE